MSAVLELNIAIYMHKSTFPMPRVGKVHKSSSNRPDPGAYSRYTIICTVCGPTTYRNGFHLDQSCNDPQTPLITYLIAELFPIGECPFRRWKSNQA